MQKVKYPFNYRGSAHATDITLTEPNLCPICKKSIRPYYLYGWTNPEAKTAYAIYECQACFNVFIKSIIDIEINPADGNLHETNTSSFSLSPNPVVPVEFTKYIKKVSPQFVEIYNQANAAECHSLHEIAGIGYRKSIEFLVKDYLISNLETDEEKENIKKNNLGKCINEHIDNPNLKAVASRAVWLGNDETHYIRKHTDTDITDLKRLINVTVRWIEMECMTHEAEAEIQPM